MVEIPGSAETATEQRWSLGFGDRRVIDAREKRGEVTEGEGDGGGVSGHACSDGRGGGEDQAKEVSYRSKIRPTAISRLGTGKNR